MGPCEPGHEDCNADSADGCEVDLANDPRNCGACGAACIGLCVQGRCEPCDEPPWLWDCNGDCSDGAETDVRLDPQNCGACGVVCITANGLPGCVDGTCITLACDAGYADCDALSADGCEVNTDSDVDNCGGCGFRCNLPTCAVCTRGSCACCESDPWCCGASTCLRNCNGTCADGAEREVCWNPDSCGGCGRVCPSGWSCQNLACCVPLGGTCTADVDCCDRRMCVPAGGSSFCT